MKLDDMLAALDVDHSLRIVRNHDEVTIASR